ncbi:ribosomal RNA small subunit methyltransferase A [bacterium]|nr:MAG: ribosomal RNA small subunit methyltransferase A [bacterium]
MKPRKSLGQNFLIDKNIQSKIIRACNLSGNDTVLEIGPGRGEITQYLLEQAGYVIAVEIDNNLYQGLIERFGSFKNLELLNADILKLSLSGLRGLGGGKKFKVIANIPYYITTPIIARLLSHGSLFSEIYLTLQKEFAERLTAGPGTKDYGAFSCFAQFYTKPKLIFTISSSAFWPRPKVDSCLARLEILDEPSVKVKDEGMFFKIIRAGFNQRRKLFKNNLSRIFPQPKAASCLSKLGLDEKVRAEDLCLSDFARIADYFT